MLKFPTNPPDGSDEHVRAPEKPSFVLRKIIAASLIATSVTTGALTTSVRHATAASVSLSEVSASPLVSNFGGWDMGFATNSIFSSAAVGDVTGDGQPDVVVGGMNS